jgi:hypothetical protein
MPLGRRETPFGRRDKPDCLDTFGRGRYPWAMKNGLYSFHMHVLDGVMGRDSGILILHDGSFIGGGPCFWSTGGNGTWKGELRQAYTIIRSLRPHAIRWPGSRQRLFRDLYRRPSRGVRH